MSLVNPFEFVNQLDQIFKQSARAALPRAYGSESDDLPTSFFMDPATLEAVLQPLAGCKCGTDCKCAAGEKCQCESQSCICDVCPNPVGWCKPSTITQFELSCDIVQHTDHFALCIDLPGVKKTDICVELIEHKHSEWENHLPLLLKVSVLRLFDMSAKIVRKERAFGRVSRHFLLPMTVDPKQITSRYADGVLHVHVPITKPLESKASKISIE